MQKFNAQVEIIDINPYVEVPTKILQQLLQDSKRTKSPIPVKGTINGKQYIQTVVKFRGLWRLYLNTPMRKTTKTTVGDEVTMTVEYDPAPRIITAPKQFANALKNNKKALAAFEKLPPYRQKEINRYLANLKSETALTRNIEKAMKFLTDKKVAGVLFR